MLKSYGPLPFCLLCLSSLLSACSDAPVKRSTVEDIADDYAEAQAARVESEMNDKIAELDRRIDALEEQQRSTSEYADAIQKQVSNNARTANANAIDEMTRRGACGRETVQDANGNYFVQNRQCTAKDLR